MRRVLQSPQDERTIDAVLLMHTPILETRQQSWPDEAACASFARHLALQPAVAQALVTLRGPLGAGKTTFARHLLRALGVQGTVKSPTYGLIETYELPGLTVHHCDFYRFNDPHEWEDAGIRDLLAGPGLKLVEWPEKAGAPLPSADLDIDITPVDSDVGTNDGAPAPRRQVRLTAYSRVGQELLA